MNSLSRAVAYLLPFMLQAACSSEMPGGGAGPGGSSSATTSTDAGAGPSSGAGASGGGASTTGSGGGPVPGEWSTLIQGTWELASGTEAYWCATRTFSEDVYVHGFRANAPLGTHHTLLLASDGSQPDSEFPCGPTLGHEMYFASGIGTDDLIFPDGVAVKIPAGTQLALNLHLFNTGADVLSGVSGTLVLALPADAVEQEAEMVLPGTMDISLPPHSTGSANGSCAFSGASTIVSVWPHMHRYGKHMTVTHDAASGPVVIHDGAFTFTEQKNYPIDPLVVSGGEGVSFVCTWDNTSDETIGFGDSTDAEMCFLGLYRYPPLSSKCGLF